jgi:CRISPR-associated protein Cas1
MEEFRFLIEAMVLGIINKRMLTPSDFLIADRDNPEVKEKNDDVPETSPCLLSDEARKVFLGEFERLMHRQVTHPSTGYTVTYRRCLDLQVQNYVQHLRGVKEYEPFTRR